MGVAALTTDGVILSAQNVDGILVEQSTQVQSEGTLFVFGTASNGYSDDGVGLNGGVSQAFTAQNCANTIIFQWMMNLTAPNSLRIRVEEGANFGEWIVATAAEYDGAFKPFAVDTTRAFDRTSATAPNLTLIVRIGIVVDLAVSGIDGSCALVDVSRRGTGMTVTGGTLIDPITPLNINTADDTTASQLGHWRRNASTGSFVHVGGVTIGNSAGTLLTVFRATNVVTTVANMPLKAGQNFYNVEGNATNPTDSIIGTEIGSGITAVGVAGGSTTGTTTDPARTITWNSLGVNVVKDHVFGHNYVIGAKMNLTSSVVKRVSCLIAQHDTVVVRGGAIVRKCTITDSVATTAGAVDLGDADPVADSFRDNTIQNNSRGILLRKTIAGDVTYNLRNIKYNSNTVADIRVDFPVASTVTLNVLEGGDTPTIENVNGSTIVINNNNSITLSPTVVGSTISVYLTGTATIVAETFNSGASFNFSVGSGVGVDIVILEGGEDDPSASVPIRISNVSFTVDQTVTINQLQDANFVG